MSQEQPQRPQPQEQQDPIRYGDVFNVSGELANKPITPRDASAMQAAENMVFGETQKGGPAAVMQSTAAVNKNRGLISHYDDKHVVISDDEYAGHRIVTESITAEVVGQYVRTNLASTPAPAKLGDDAVTVGEALEAVALSPSAGGKPVDHGDAAAIQAAEVRATGRMQAVPGGVAAKAQAAAVENARMSREDDKIELGDVVVDATSLLPEDKPATRVDAEAVVAAEMRNRPDLATCPGGVASAVAGAAKVNQEKHKMDA